MSLTKVQPILLDLISSIALTSDGQIRIEPGGNLIFTDSGGEMIANGASSDIKDVKVTSNDTTPGFLLDKIVAGVGIQITELNDAGNETLEIAETGGGGNEYFENHQRFAINRVQGSGSGVVVVGHALGVIPRLIVWTSEGGGGLSETGSYGHSLVKADGTAVSASVTTFEDFTSSLNDAPAKTGLDDSNYFQVEISGIEDDEFTLTYTKVGTIDVNLNIDIGLYG